MTSLANGATKQETEMNTLTTKTRTLRTSKGTTCTCLKERGLGKNETGMTGCTGTLRELLRNEETGEERELTGMGNLNAERLAEEWGW